MTPTSMDALSQGQGHSPPSAERSTTGRPRSLLERLDVLLVGGGHRGLGVHVPTIEASGRMRIVGVVDTVGEMPRLRSEIGQRLSVWGSMDEALARVRPHLVVVATPHDTHVDLAQELLHRGVPTAVEKPPARTSEEMEGLISASRRSGTPLATLLPLRHSVPHQRLRKELQAIRGTGYRVHIAARVAPYPGVGEWRHSRTRAGGGVVLDLGYHYLDWLFSLAADEPTLMVKVSGGQDEDSVESEATIELEFPMSEISARLELSAIPGCIGSSEIRVNGDGWSYTATRQGLKGCGPTGELVSLRAPARISPARTELDALATSGFHRGAADWYEDLEHHRRVLANIGRIYGTAFQPSLCPAGLVS